MTSSCSSSRLAGPALTFMLLTSSPALADHLGPSAFGAGGGMSVFSPDTLDAGHWAASAHITYTRPEQRSDAELAELASEGVGAHNSDYNVVASVGAAYGINHHLTFSAELPYIRRDDLREGTHEEAGGAVTDGVERLGSVAGIGDMNLLVKYRLTDDPRLGLALIAGIKLPTGSTHKRSSDGERLETEHQPGSGSWDQIVGMSGSALLGPVTLTMSALYQFSRRGAQQTQLGDRLQGGIALSHSFGARSPLHSRSLNHHHGDELDEQAGALPSPSWAAFVELAGEWEGRQTIDGEVEEASGGKWAWVAPGLRYTAASGWSASVAVALPVSQRIRSSHPDNRWRLTVGMGRAF